MRFNSKLMGSQRGKRIFANIDLVMFVLLMFKLVGGTQSLANDSLEKFGEYSYRYVCAEYGSSIEISKDGKNILITQETFNSESIRAKQGGLSGTVYQKSGLYPAVDKLKRNKMYLANEGYFQIQVSPADVREHNIHLCNTNGNQNNMLLIEGVYARFICPYDGKPKIIFLCSNGEYFIAEIDDFTGTIHTWLGDFVH